MYAAAAVCMMMIYVKYIYMKDFKREYFDELKAASLFYRKLVAHSQNWFLI